MQLYVVVDTMGGGRIIGVFASREVAAELLAIEPSYYRVHPCDLDAINPESLTWARTDEQRDRLRRRMLSSTT